MTAERMGDLHNFGRSVSVKNGWVYKPRSVYWEKTFLEESSLRVYINKAFNSMDIISPFTLAPTLKVEVESWFSGRVEYLNLDKIRDDFKLDIQHIKSIGALLGLAHWFGLGDLHRENIKIGMVGGKLICFPIDIECIFDFSLHLNQTLLIPTKKINENQCGLSNLWQHLINSSDINKLHLLNAFKASIEILNDNSEELLKIILSDGQAKQAPVRVIFKDTHLYSKALNKKATENFENTELEQLNRGDIPFYFRLLQNDKILYFNSENTVCAVNKIPESFKTSFHILNDNFKHATLKKESFLALNIHSIARSLGLSSKLESSSSVSIDIEGKEFVYKN